MHSVPPGESPPPPPRTCFGRDELIEKIVGLAGNLTPIALIGAGGIGKTSIVLTVLHHDRIKERFGDNRRFIRCDEFPASHTHLLNRLSEVTGAGVENPESLAPLRPFLLSRKIILVLDNAESILDPLQTNARGVYAIVEELSQFGNICLCVTSRISTVPPACDTLNIPTLSTEAARDTFYRIYKNGGRSDLIDGILDQLDFHPLSIALLATVAHHDRWCIERLGEEWERQQTDVLRTKHGTSLAATIELSLSSPMFQELGPGARELLGVVAFFPQGINENNLDWLFPTLPNRTTVFDHFCVLSLVYRSNGFITMLAPLRDYLCPKDPTSSPLLSATKDHYFCRLSVLVEPGEQGFEEARWIMSEDVNVERLLNIFTSIDTNSAESWDACSNFMRHLYWHKPRLVTLGPKIEGLPDDHPSKPQCLHRLSRLFHSVGDHAESKRLLIHNLKLRRERGEDFQVAETLRFMSEADQLLGHHEEGIQRVKEALVVYGRLNNKMGQAHARQRLGQLLYEDKQFDAAEEATSEALHLFSDKHDQFEVCKCRRILGNICHSRGEIEKAIDHFKTALGIASSFDWADPLVWIHYSLAELFFGENRFDDAHVHVGHAKSHATNDPYGLGRVMELQAGFWYKQHMLQEAKSEALRAADLYEKIGTVKDAEHCSVLLRKIEEAASDEIDSSGELAETVPLSTPVDLPFSAHGTGRHVASLFRHNHQPRVRTDIPFLAIVPSIFAITSYPPPFLKDFLSW